MTDSRIKDETFHDASRRAFIKTTGLAAGAAGALLASSSVFSKDVDASGDDEYGISPKDVEWVLSAKDSSAGISGGASKFESVFPKGLSVRNGSPGKDESDLLVSGEVDSGRRLSMLA